VAHLERLGKEMKSCTFCSIIEGKTPASVVLDSEKMPVKRCRKCTSTSYHDILRTVLAGAASVSQLSAAIWMPLQPKRGLRDLQKSGRTNRPPERRPAASVSTER
jgi:hypothetical protein